MNPILQKVLDFVFPESCILCELELSKAEKYICASCVTLLPTFEPHIYESHQKYIDDLKFNQVNALYIYSKSTYVQKIIHLIKYKEHKDLAHLLGQEYARKNNIDQFDLITPVPLHPKRLKTRGYNQSMEWAKGMVSKANIELKNVLVRTENTSSQTSKNRMERWENVSNSFKLHDEASVVGKKILLVDDVITTGATIASCSKVLFDHGASEVQVASIAIAH